MTPPTITLNGIAYVVLTRAEYQRLLGFSRIAALKADEAPGLLQNRWDKSNIASEIIRARVELGLSQAELARRAGIRIESLNRIERGRFAPKLSTLKAIEDVLIAAERDQDR